MLTTNALSSKSGYIVLNQRESLSASISKDLVTFGCMAFCIYVSRTSGTWTAISVVMFLLFLFARTARSLPSICMQFESIDALAKWVREQMNEHAKSRERVQPGEFHERLDLCTAGEATVGVNTIEGREMIVVGILGTSRAIALCGYVGAHDEAESRANAVRIALAWNAQNVMSTAQ